MKGEQNIRQRQAEGIAAAKARGQKFGRPKVPLPENFETVLYARINGEITQTEAARECGLPLSTYRGREKEFTDGCGVIA